MDASLAEALLGAAGGSAVGVGLGRFLIRKYHPGVRWMLGYARQYAEDARGKTTERLEWDLNWYRTKCETKWIMDLKVEAITKELERRGHRQAAEDAHRGAGESAGADPGDDADAAADPGEDVSEIPDLIEPIVGWRCWTATTDGYLVALNGGYSDYPPTWKPRTPLRARCASSEKMSSMLAGHGVSPDSNDHKHGPRESCSCGYYAAKLVADAQFPQGNYAYGRVAMWGRVVEHEGGFRAEYAYPIEVFLVAASGTKRYYSQASGAVIEEEVTAWTPDQVERIRKRMEIMYGCLVHISSEDALEDEWAAQWLDVPLPEQVAPLIDEVRNA